MTRKGYLFLYRKLLDHEISENPLIVALWIRILIDAHYQDEVCYWEGKTYEIKKGQVITSIEKLAKWLRLSRSTTARHLNELQKIGQIDIKTTTKYTVITIRNYDKYQADGHQIKPMVNRPTSNDTTDDTTDRHQNLGTNQPQDKKQNGHQIDQLTSQLTSQQTDTENKYKNIRNKEYKNITSAKPMPQVGKISEKPRKEISYPKGILDDVVNYYVQRKGIIPQGNEWLPIQQQVKSMFMNGRTPDDIKEFICWLSTHWGTWDIFTVAKRMPEFVAGKLDQDKTKINPIKLDPIYVRLQSLKGDDDLSFRQKMALRERLDSKYPKYKYENFWKELSN